MANIKISELNLTEDLTNSYIPGIKENTNGSFDTKKFSLNDLQNSIDTNSNSILYGIDEFSNDKSYYKGEYVTYNNNIYKFIDFHSPGEWVSTDVTRISVFSELELLNSFNNETLNIHLESSDNNLNTSGIIVIITYNNTTLQETCDSNGNCSFNIPKNSEYTINVPAREGYQEVENITGIANTSIKNVNIIYQKNIPSTCNLKLYFTISSLTEEINQYINDLNDFTVTLTSSLNNETVSSNINNGIAIFNNIETNTEYTISFPTVQGYIKPNIQQFIAYSDSELTVEYKKIQHYNDYGVYLVISIENVDYEIKINNLYDGENNWIGKAEINGENYDVSQDNAKAFHICPEGLATTGNDYFVKIEDLVANTRIQSTWSNPDYMALVSNFPVLSNNSTNYNTTTYPNGKLYTYYLFKSSIINPTNNDTMLAHKIINKKLTYNEKTLGGFVGSIYQYGFIFSNYYNDIRTITETGLGLTFTFIPGAATSTTAYWTCINFNPSQSWACGPTGPASRTKVNNLYILPLYS